MYTELDIILFLPEKALDIKAYVLTSSANTDVPKLDTIIVPIANVTPNFLIFSSNSLYVSLPLVNIIFIKM